MQAETETRVLEALERLGRFLDQVEPLLDRLKRIPLYRGWFGGSD
jgi:hypothetical protein